MSKSRLLMQKMGAYKKQLAQILEVVGKPEILFADEPTGNLDSKTGGEIMNLLRKINQSIGQMIIMVTHSPEAARSSSRMITVQDGMIL